MAGLKDYRPLRLRVEGEEDLSALSTSLQDAVAKIGDFAYRNQIFTRPVVG